MEQFSLFTTPATPAEDHPSVQALESLDPDNLSQKPALDALYQVKKTLD